MDPSATACRVCTCVHVSCTVLARAIANRIGVDIGILGYSTSMWFRNVMSTFYIYPSVKDRLQRPSINTKCHVNVAVASTVLYLPTSRHYLHLIKRVHLISIYMYLPSVIV